MLDRWGRNIDYLRISVTDRCNLRCRYCMPEGIHLVPNSEMLTYEEILRICRAAVALGIDKFKVTGGEPLVRRGCLEFLSVLKALPGVAQVTLTTNGLLLEQYAGRMAAMGLDGVNVSLDTVDEDKYRLLTGFSGDGVETVRRALAACVGSGLRTKVNAVLLSETFDDIAGVAMLARELPVDVRFIERMPIGAGAAAEGVPLAAARQRLRELFPDLEPAGERRGNGPAGYCHSEDLQGRIGLIGAVSESFCESCNRVRLTGTGKLKLCLCYGKGSDLRGLLRGGCTDGALREAMAACIAGKPRAHCFRRRSGITEGQAMNEIGG